jgi:hypothetical protein
MTDAEYRQICLALVREIERSLERGDKVRAELFTRELHDHLFHPAPAPPQVRH